MTHEPDVRPDAALAEEQEVQGIALLTAWLQQGSIGEREIEGIISDSRQAGTGKIFFALRGYETDGHRYLRQAEAGGCLAAVVEEEDPELQIPQCKVPDTKEALATACSIFFGTEDAEIPHVAVTGTAGKTTTSTMIAHILQSFLGSVGLITTNGIYCPGFTQTEMENTTPDAITLHRTVAKIKALGCRAVVVEASSHGIEQRRVAGLPFRYAVYTNLSHEHLDYHKSMEAYADAKARLFTDLPEDAYAIVNLRDPWVDRIIGHCRARIIGFALAHELAQLDKSEEGARRIARCERIITADAITPSAEGQLSFTLSVDGSAPVRVRSRMIGHFNVRNMLAAAGVALAMGYGPDAIAPHLASFEGVVGRQERIDRGQPFAVLMDFAHTPVALETLLKTVRPLTRGALRLVLAVAGERDREKRSEMAALGARYADDLILTLQKTLREDPRQILHDLTAGLEGEDYEIDPVRPSAIRRAIMRSRANDMVVVIGIMSPTHLEMGKERIPYKDREIIEDALSERLIRDRLAPYFDLEGDGAEIPVDRG